MAPDTLEKITVVDDWLKQCDIKLDDVLAKVEEKLELGQDGAATRPAKRARTEVGGDETSPG